MKWKRNMLQEEEKGRGEDEKSRKPSLLTQQPHNWW